MFVKFLVAAFPWQPPYLITTKCSIVRCRLRTLHGLSLGREGRPESRQPWISFRNPLLPGRCALRNPIFPLYGCRISLAALLQWTVEKQAEAQAVCLCQGEIASSERPPKVQGRGGNLTRKGRESVSSQGGTHLTCHHWKAGDRKVLVGSWRGSLGYLLHFQPMRDAASQTKTNKQANKTPKPKNHHHQQQQQKPLLVGSA